MIKTFNLKANQPLSVASTGRYLNILIAAGTIKVAAYGEGGNKFESDLYKGCAPVLEAKFDRFEFTSQVEQQVKVWISQYPMTTQSSEMRSVGSENISSNQGRAFHGFANLIAAAEAGRGKVLLQSESEVYIGGPNVTVDNGFSLAAGGVLPLETQGAVYAVSPRPEDKLIEVPSVGTVSLQKEIPASGNVQSIYYGVTDRIWRTAAGGVDMVAYSDDYGETWISLPTAKNDYWNLSPFGLIARDPDHVSMRLCYGAAGDGVPVAEKIDAAEVGGTIRALTHNKNSQMLAIVTQDGVNKALYCADASADAREWAVVDSVELAEALATNSRLDWLTFLGDDKFCWLGGDNALAFVFSAGVVSSFPLAYHQTTQSATKPVATSDGRVVYHCTNGNTHVVGLAEIAWSDGEQRFAGQSLFDGADRYNKAAQWGMLLALGNIVAWCITNNAIGLNPMLYIKDGVSGEKIEVHRFTNGEMMKSFGVFKAGLMMREYVFSGEVAQRGGTVVNVLREVN